MGKMFLTLLFVVHVLAASNDRRRPVKYGYRMSINPRNVEVGQFFRVELTTSLPNFINRTRGQTALAIIPFRDERGRILSCNKSLSRHRTQVKTQLNSKAHTDYDAQHALPYGLYAYATFYAPAYAFKICVRHNSTNWWDAPTNIPHFKPWNTTAPRTLWELPTNDFRAGTWASFRLTSTSFPFNYVYDNVKIVRFRGVPTDDICIRDRPGEIYPGSQSTSSGVWTTPASSLIDFNAETGTVALLGDSSTYSITTQPSVFPQTLYAQVQLPTTTGNYVLCYSSYYERLNYNTGQPGWKLLMPLSCKGIVECGISVGFTVVKTSQAISWSSIDLRGGTFAAIQFSGSGLSSKPSSGGLSLTANGDRAKVVLLSSVTPTSTTATSGCFSEVSFGTGYTTSLTDLGSDPYDATKKEPWKSDEENILTTWAYFRVPAFTTEPLSFCYRIAGKNWQVASPNAFLPNSRQLSNVTYQFNDTRALTYGALVLTSTNRDLSTMPSVWGGGLASNPVVKENSVCVKIVQVGMDCQTSPAEFGGESYDVGGMEVLPWSQGSTFRNEDRGSRLQSLPRLNTFVVAYLRVPPVRTNGFSICFRRGLRNWEILKPSPFRPKASPQLTYTLTDVRSGTLGKLLITSRSISLNVRPVSNAGDMIRIIRNRTQCDYTRTNDVNDISVFDLGKYTPSTGETDSQSDDTGILGAVAYFILPLPLSSPKDLYQVCYRFGNGQWINLDMLQGTKGFSTTRVPTYKYASGIPIGGSVGYIDFNIGSLLDLKFDVRKNGDEVKLVASNHQCDRAVLERATSWDLTETNSTFFQNSDNSSTSSSRAYLAFPRIVSSALSLDVRICYRNNGYANWFPLSPLLTVFNYQIAYRSSQRPIAGSYLRINVRADGALRLNTTLGGDQLKLIGINDVCLENTSSFGVIIRDMEPGDQVGQVEAYGTIFIPPVSAATSYRVCYLPYGKQWVELPLGNNMKGYKPRSGETEFVIQPNPIESLTFDPKLLINNNTNVVGGAQTVYQEDNLLWVTGNVNFAADRFKIVRVGETCDYEAIPGTFASSKVTNLISGRFIGRVVHPIIQIPVVPGTYKACYLTTTLSSEVWSSSDEVGTWVLIPGSSFEVVDNMLRFDVNADKNIQVTDAIINLTTWESNPSLVASRVQYVSDLVKLVPYSIGAHCGALTTVSRVAPSLPVDTFGEDDTVTSLSRVISMDISIPTNATTFMVCYFKRVSTTIARSGIWMQIPQLYTNAVYLESAPADHLVLTKFPIYNVSKGAPPGSPLNFQVEIRNSKNNRVFTQDPDFLITVQDSNKNSPAIVVTSTRGCKLADVAQFQPLYPSNNLIIPKFGRADLTLFINDDCGRFGCTITFTATGLAPATFTVGTRSEPTYDMSSTPNGEGSDNLMNSGDAIYQVIDTFTLNLFALTQSGIRNMASRVSVTLTPNVPTTSIVCELVADNSTCTSGPTVFQVNMRSGGSVGIRFRFLVGGLIRFTIAIDAASNNGITGNSIVRSLSVKSLVTRQLLVTDIQPVSTSTPAWFPLGILPSQNIISAPGSYFVKKAAYKAYLQPRNEIGKVLPRTHFVLDVRATIVDVSDISIDEQKNQIVVTFTPSFGCGSFSDAQPFATVGLCNIIFSIGDAQATILANVRAISTQLKWDLFVPTLTTAPGQAIPFGSLLAVDADGELDVYNYALIYPLMQGGNGISNDDGINVTLSFDTKRNETSKAMTNGKVLFDDLTLTKPCDGNLVCRLSFHSSWGDAFVLSPQIRALDTTHHLRGNISTNTNLVVNQFYTVTITAVDINNVPTAYDTSWIVVFLSSPTGPLAPPIEVVGGRFQPLVNSKRSFQFRFQRTCPGCVLRFMAKSQNGWTGVGSNNIWDTSALIVTSTVNAIKLELDSVSSSLIPAEGYVPTTGNGTTGSLKWYQAQMKTEFTVTVKATDINGLLATGGTASYPIRLTMTSTGRRGDGDGGNLTTVPVSAISSTSLSAGKATFVFRLDSPCLRCEITFIVDRFDPVGYLKLWVSVLTVATKLQLSFSTPLPSVLDPFTSFGSGEYSSPLIIEAVDNNGIVDFRAPLDVVMTQTGGLGGRQVFYCHDDYPCNQLDQGFASAEITRTAPKRTLREQVEKGDGGRAVFNFAGRNGNIRNVVLKWFTASKNFVGFQLDGYQSSGDGITWTSSKPARRFVVLNVTTGLGSGWPVQDVNGYVSLSTRPIFDYTLSSSVYANAGFPITVQIQDASGRRVPTATGKVQVTYYAHTGCGTGLPISFETTNGVKDLVAGNVTFWITFSSVCDGCLLQFVYIGDAAIVETTRVQVTYPIRVNSFAANRIVLRSGTNLPSRLSTSTELSMTFEAISFIGGVAYRDPTYEGYQVVIYSLPLFQPGSFSNGGMLLVNNGTAQRYATAAFVRGVATVNIKFTRSCTTCQLFASSPFSAQPSFTIRNSNSNGLNTFFVQTLMTDMIIRTQVPSNVVRGQDFDIVLWQVDQFKELYFFQDVDVAILLSREAGGGNGDGGLFRHTNSVNVSFIQTRWILGTQVWRMQWGAACDSCTFKLGQFTIVQRVSTTASRVVVVKSNLTNGQTIPVGAVVQFQLELWDDNGNVDRDVAQTQWFPLLVNSSVSPVDIVRPSGLYGAGSPQVIGSYTFTNGVSSSVLVRFTDTIEMSYVIFSLPQHPAKISNVAVLQSNWLQPPMIRVTPLFTDVMLLTVSPDVVVAGAPFPVTVSLANALGVRYSWLNRSYEVITNSTTSGCIMTTTSATTNSNATVTFQLTLISALANSTQRSPTSRLCSLVFTTIVNVNATNNRTITKAVNVLVTVPSLQTLTPTPQNVNFITNVTDVLTFSLINSAFQTDIYSDGITFDLSTADPNNILACPTIATPAVSNNGKVSFRIQMKNFTGTCQLRITSQNQVLARDNIVTIVVTRPQRLRITTNLTNSLIDDRVIAGQTYILRGTVESPVGGICLGDRSTVVTLKIRMVTNNPRTNPVSSPAVATAEYIGTQTFNVTNGTFFFAVVFKKPTPLNTMLQVGVEASNSQLRVQPLPDWTEELEVIVVAKQLQAVYDRYNSASSQQQLNLTILAVDELGNVASLPNHIGKDVTVTLVNVEQRDANVTQFLDVSNQLGNNLNTVKMQNGGAKFALKYSGLPGRLLLYAKTKVLAYTLLEILYQSVSDFVINASLTNIQKGFTFQITLFTKDTIGEFVPGDNSTMFNITSTGPSGNVIAMDAQSLNRTVVNGAVVYVLSYGASGRDNVIQILMTYGAGLKLQKTISSVHISAPVTDLENQVNSFQPRALLLEVGSYKNLTDFNVTIFSQIIASGVPFASPKHVNVQQVCYATIAGKLSSVCLSSLSRSRREEITSAVIVSFNFKVSAADIPPGYNPDALDYFMVDSLIQKVAEAKKGTGPYAVLQPGSVLLGSDAAAAPDPTSPVTVAPPTTTSSPMSSLPPWMNNNTGGANETANHGVSSSVSVMLVVVVFLLALW